MCASANAFTFAAISSAAACLSGGSVGYGKSSSPLNLPKNSALAKPTSGAGDQFLDLLLLLGDLLGRESHCANPRIGPRGEDGIVERTAMSYSIRTSNGSGGSQPCPELDPCTSNTRIRPLPERTLIRPVRSNLPDGDRLVDASTHPAAPVDHERIRRAVREILAAVGENPDREGLLETPDRVARMYAEMFSGLHTDPAVHLQKTFTQKHDEMVLVKDIEFASCCEHHLLPFIGKAHIAYLPNGQDRRPVEAGPRGGAVARRPQVQERMTEEIADLIMTHLKPRGVGVIVEASHTCMTIRGVRKPGAMTITSSMRGGFLDHPADAGGNDVAGVREVASGQSSWAVSNRSSSGTRPACCDPVC